MQPCRFSPPWSVGDPYIKARPGLPRRPRRQRSGAAYALFRGGAGTPKLRRPFVRVHVMYLVTCRTSHRLKTCWSSEVSSATKP